jgi:hypothetical protein
MTESIPTSMPMDFEQMSRRFGIQFIPRSRFRRLNRKRGLRMGRLTVDEQFDSIFARGWYVPVSHANAGSAGWIELIRHVRLLSILKPDKPQFRFRRQRSGPDHMTLDIADP